MFYQMIIPHHQGAIDQSILAHGANVRAEFDSLAHHTIEEQRMEQQEFRDSLRVIFGVQQAVGSGPSRAGDAGTRRAFPHAPSRLRAFFIRNKIQSRLPADPGAYSRLVLAHPAPCVNPANHEPMLYLCLPRGGHTGAAVCPNRWTRG